MKHQAESMGEFCRAGSKELGYKMASVDAFFARLADDYELMLGGAELGKEVHTSRTVREMIFPAELGGYSAADVDRALDAVEDRFASLERSLYIRTYGQQAWESSLGETKNLLRGRLEREAGSRFRRPSKKLTKGYFVKEVDSFCERMLAHLNGGVQLVAADVRACAFSPASGDLAYDETQVDAFMDRCIEYVIDTRE